MMSSSRQTDLWTNTVLNTIQELLDIWLHQDQSPDTTRQAVKVLDFSSLLSRPPAFELGQAALPCHQLARIFKKSPLQIADRLRQIWLESSNNKVSVSKGMPTNPHLIERIEAVQGYLNFFCDFQVWGQILLEQIISGDFFKGPLIAQNEKEKINIEFSQPNTHKALHVGHLRNTVYGDAVCRILEYCGHDVIRATYPGDMGAHIAKSLWFIMKHKGGKLPTEHQADWLGEVYAASDDYVRSVEDAQMKEQIKSEIGAVLRELQEKNGPYYDLYLLTRDWSLKQMREVYEWLGVDFAVWYYESECDKPSRQLVLQKYKEGFFKESQGAIGLDLSDWNLGFALYLKSDGNGLYLTKDLELIRQKFNDPSVTRSIVVVDARQRLHFQQLFKTAELMGYPQATRSVHLSYESVTTPDGVPCSSRNLNGVLLDDLREVMEKKVIQDHLQSYRGDWSDAEIEKTACEVALGALKYGFLKVDPQTIVKFQLEEWLRLDGDTGPYLQYVHARAQSLLEKLAQTSAVAASTAANAVTAATAATSSEPQSTVNFSLPARIQWETLFEKELLFHLAQFNKVVRSSGEQYKPTILTTYLLELAQYFNRFYKECPIRTVENRDIQNSRKALVQATVAVLTQGLCLLGIPAPRRM